MGQASGPRLVELAFPEELLNPFASCITGRALTELHPAIGASIWSSWRESMIVGLHFLGTPSSHTRRHRRLTTLSSHIPSSTTRRSKCCEHAANTLRSLMPEHASSPSHRLPESALVSSPRQHDHIAAGDLHVDVPIAPIRLFGG